MARAPSDAGLLELIVRRPVPGERETIEAGELTFEEGLVGDGWLARGSRQSPDGSAEVPRQITLMNSRAAALFAGDRTQWPLAGDQLYVDFDLSEGNLPAGTRLRIGTATVEVSVEPHTGCQKFTQRFGLEATRLLRVTGRQAVASARHQRARDRTGHGLRRRRRGEGAGGKAQQLGSAGGAWVGAARSPDQAARG